MSGKINLNIDMASTMPGGDYGKVMIDGAGKIEGDLRCERLCCDGGASIEGSVECLGEVESSGMLKIVGNLQCEALESDGAITIEGDMQSESLEINGRGRIAGAVHTGDTEVNGKLSVKGAFFCKDLEVNGSADFAAGVHGEKVEMSGSCKVEGDLEADEVEITGSVDISGLLNGEKILIDADSRAKIGDIGGSEIKVLHSGHKIVVSLFGGRRAGGERSRGLTVNSIEGDVVEVVNTTAKVIRGRNITIGHGCRIDCVEYSGQFTAAEGTVTQAVKVE